MSGTSSRRPRAAEAARSAWWRWNARRFITTSTRQQAARHRVEETGLPLAYVNLTGGQDELVFDGASFAPNRAGEVAVQLPAYDDALGWVDYADGDFVAGAVMAALPVAGGKRLPRPGGRRARLYRQNGFPARAAICPAALIGLTLAAAGGRAGRGQGASR